MLSCFSSRWACLDSGVLSFGNPSRGLPGRNLSIPHHFNLLKSLTLSFREHEVDMDGHNNTENKENNVSSPGNVLEGSRNEHGKGKMKDPVGTGRDTRGKSTLSGREDFRAVEPNTGTPGRSKTSNNTSKKQKWWLWKHACSQLWFSQNRYQKGLQEE